MIVPVLSRSISSGRLARWAQLLPKIKELRSQFASLGDHQLRKQSLALRYRARSGELLHRLLPQAYAMVSEAARRTLAMQPYDVQLLGAIAMHHGSIAEMQTGEGKTLTAVFPLYLASLLGKGAHLATANDYLARRDAEWMQPIYSALGLTVGVVESGVPRIQRLEAYRSDVTYGTAKEFGFDFLRDRLLDWQQDDAMGDLLANMLAQHREGSEREPVQRGHFFALVDEADSILIDESRTPLIVSSLPDQSREMMEQQYRWSAQVAEQFEPGADYELDDAHRSVTLTYAGRQRVRSLTKPMLLAELGMLDLYSGIERAIKVNQYFVRDQHYVVRDDEVVIVDELTGRLAEGRRWRSGMHQAIEAREGVTIGVETGDAARVTVQDYFLKYESLAGMTGTAASSDQELRTIYGMRVVRVPTHRPLRRRELPTRVLATASEKWEAIIEETLEVHNTGRPVLIGTRSIDKSEHLSSLLDEVGLEHRVLNARQLQSEAEIIAAAGGKRRVTVATNMAGRGTDIKLENEVAESGGLHVICSELHESARIDRQLFGRCGRQGDTGSYRQYAALDDEILAAGLGRAKAEQLRRLGERRTGPLDHLVHLFRRAQANVERQHFRQRKMLLYQENQRRRVQAQMGQNPYLETISG